MLRHMLGILLLTVSTGRAHAQDGSNLLINPGFEQQAGTPGWDTFGNAFANSEVTYEGVGSLKTFGCFCADFNANGVISSDPIPAVAGQIYEINALAMTPSWDSIYGVTNWAAVKAEFRDGNEAVIGLSEHRIFSGDDPKQTPDTWIGEPILAVAPTGTTSIRFVVYHMQTINVNGGAVYFDNLSLAESERDSSSPLINGGFDNGVDYSYSVFQVFNGWELQYGNIFFDDFQYRSPPFSAGMFGSFPDNDGDGNCDPDGVSGLGQTIPNISEGQTISLETSCMTPNFDSIMGTRNLVLHQIEFFGADTNTPLSRHSAVILDGLDATQTDDIWYESTFEATAPPGTLAARVDVMIIQPDCEGGAVRIDDVRMHVQDPPVDACPGDFNDDGEVSGTDMGLLLGYWNNFPGYPEADLNGDGEIGSADLGLLLSYWGGCP